MFTVWFEAHLAIVLGVALCVVAAIVILQQRRTPQSTAAWLLFILLAPYLALPIFLALGFRKSGAHFTAVRFHTAGIVSVPVTEVDSMFAHYGIPPSMGDNTFRLIEDGAVCWDEVLTLVTSASKTLDVSYYLIANDAVGARFVEALTERVRAGVRVRLIIDRLGGFWRPSRALAEFRRAGGMMHDFSPLIQRPDRGHLNLRNHRKMIIADGARVMSGGRNIGADYLGPGRDDSRWIDLSFVTSGPVVQSFADVFASDWAATGREDSHSAVTILRGGTTRAQLVPSGPDMNDDPLHDGLVCAIHAARSRVWIATPYLLPTDHLTHALRTAAKRGVDVRLMLPDVSNQTIADLARGSYLRGLAGAGCTILRYRRGMMHAKAWVVDDTAAVGSANLDVRSMLLNFEMMLFVHDHATVAGFEGWFTRMFRDCDHGLREAGFFRRLVEGMFRLGAPIL